jgi:hypothetical protein
LRGEDQFGGEVHLRKPLNHLAWKEKLSDSNRLLRRSGVVCGGHKLRGN